MYPRQSGAFWGQFFVHFFPGKISGKISGKILLKIFPQKCWEKMEFSAKSFEKLFFQEILRNFPQKITFRGKKMYEKSAPDWFQNILN
jgi:hypothetical protein